MSERNRVWRRSMVLLICGAAALLIWKDEGGERPGDTAGFAAPSSLSLDVRLDLGVITATVRLAL